MSFIEKKLELPIFKSDQGLLNCLDPGPFRSKWSMHVLGEGGGLPLGRVVPDSCRGGSRDPESMETIQWLAASLHTGCAAAKSGYQQSEHVVFRKNANTALPWKALCICIHVYISFRKIKCCSIQQHASILCLSRQKTWPAFWTIIIFHESSLSSPCLLSQVRLSLEPIFFGVFLWRRHVSFLLRFVTAFDCKDFTAWINNSLDGWAESKVSLLAGMKVKSSQITQRYTSFNFSRFFFSLVEKVIYFLVCWTHSGSPPKSMYWYEDVGTGGGVYTWFDARRS